MDRGSGNIVVSVRALLVVGLVGLALVAAYLVGGAGGTTAAAADDPPSPRTVTVVGVGHTSVVPDQLAFDLSVQVTRPDLDVALADANTATQTAVDAVRAEGVAAKDVQTTGLSMYPQYRHQKGQPRTFEGYQVSQSVTVLVEDLARASATITAAAGAAGPGVQVTDLRLQVGDPDAALQPARTAAYDQARAKAAEYAGDVGLSLGDVVRVSELAPTSVDVAQSASSDASAAAAGPEAIPIQAGQTDLTAQVTVVFELGG